MTSASLWTCRYCDEGFADKRDRDAHQFLAHGPGDCGSPSDVTTEQAMAEMGAMPDEEVGAHFKALVSRLPDLPHGALAGGRTAEPLAFDDDSFPPMGCPFDEPLPPIEVPITTRAERAEAEMGEMLAEEVAAHQRTRDRATLLGDAVEGALFALNEMFEDDLFTWPETVLATRDALTRAHEKGMAMLVRDATEPLAKYDDNPEETPDAE